MDYQCIFQLTATNLKNFIASNIMTLSCHTGYVAIGVQPFTHHIVGMHSKVRTEEYMKIRRDKIINMNI